MLSSEGYSDASERISIADVYEAMERPEQFTFEGVQYRCEKGRFILERCPTDYPAETFVVPHA